MAINLNKYKAEKEEKLRQASIKRLLKKANKYWGKEKI